MTEAERHMDSVQLVERAIAGDVAAFEQLVQENMKTILYQARRYIHKPEDAEDAAQEAIIAMYRSIGTLRNPEAFRSWMYRLIKFVCLKHVRSQESGSGDTVVADMDEYAESLRDDNHGSDPEEWVEERERSEIIAGLINALPEKQRESIILFYYEGLSYKEIGRALGATTSAVSTNIMKAKKNILKGMKNEDFGLM